MSVWLDPRIQVALAGLLPSGLCVVNLDSGEFVRTIATPRATAPIRWQ